jgi:phenylalanyl-tRNA synthetase beta chain
MTVSQIINDSPIGIQFGHLVSQFNTYPILLDSAKEVVSLPPIVNGSLSHVDSSARNLFLEVTGIDPKAVRDILNVLSVTLFDAGFKIKTVRVVRNHNSLETPQIPVKKIKVAIAYVNSLIGIELSAREIKRCLEKSRLGASVSGGQIICYIPAYRIDIATDIDLVEEVAIGYGISRLRPTFPASAAPGGISPISRMIEALRDSLVGLGLLEMIGFSLTNAEVQYSPFGIDLPKQVLRVDSSKSADHEILRSSLTPSLLQALSRNVHEAYPQRVFEIGKVFSESTRYEGWAVAAATAHVNASFTESKSTAAALLRTAFGLGISTQPIEYPYYVPGRAGAIIVEGRTIGSIGEITPRALEWFKLRMPVSTFELSISELIAHRNQTIKEI